MTKRQIIDEILTLNRSAKPEFLAGFEDTDLDQYLRHLRVARTPRLSGDPHRYDKYFEDLPTIGRAGPAVAVVESDDVPAETPEDAAAEPIASPEGAAVAASAGVRNRPPFAEWRE